MLFLLSCKTLSLICCKIMCNTKSWLELFLYNKSHPAKGSFESNVKNIIAFMKGDFITECCITVSNNIKCNI